MKNYHKVLTIFYASISGVALLYGSYQTFALGLHNSWWYFVTGIFAMFLCYKHYKGWKNVDWEEKSSNNPKK